MSSQPLSSVACSLQGWQWKTHFSAFLLQKSSTKTTKSSHPRWEVLWGLVLSCEPTAVKSLLSTLNLNLSELTNSSFLWRKMCTGCAQGTLVSNYCLDATSGPLWPDQGSAAHTHLFLSMIVFKKISNCTTHRDRKSWWWWSLRTRFLSSPENPQRSHLMETVYSHPDEGGPQKLQAYQSHLSLSP